VDRSDRDMRLLFRPSRAAHATLHATASRLGLRTEGDRFKRSASPSPTFTGLFSCGFPYRPP